MNIPKELYLFDDSGMAKWIRDEVSAAKKRKAMSDVTSRFVNKLTSDFELKTMSRGFVQKSTEKSTIWAVHNFQSWCDWREKQGNPVPKDLLECKRWKNVESMAIALCERDKKSRWQVISLKDH